MSEPLVRLYRLLFAVPVAGATAVGCLVLLSLAGLFTGVIGPGATSLTGRAAPGWWGLVYLPLFFLAPPLCALWAGLRVQRGFARV